MYIYPRRNGCNLSIIFAHFEQEIELLYLDKKERLDLVEQMKEIIEELLRGIDDPSKEVGCDVITG